MGGGPVMTEPVFDWNQLVEDEGPWWRRALRRLQFWRRKRCRPIPCPSWTDVDLVIEPGEWS
jgi:hypothetical protein